MERKEVSGLFARLSLVTCVMALVGLIALSNCPVFAQGFSATITGTVQDSSGAAVAGAAVTVKHLETGLTRTVETDSNGSYRITSLPVGAYELTADKMGFERELRRGINLVVAQEAVLNLTLQVGSMVQQVTVTEDAPLVNTTTVSTSGLISEEQIKELPLNGRSFDQLLTLNVGTANNSANTLNNNSWTAFSVAGKRPETNRFLINGIDYIGGNASGLFITPSGASGMLLGVEAVREYNVLPNSYGAEYGKRAGGQISIVTSSGTNQLHGEVFEYLRNNALDARNPFDQTPAAPPFKRNQFGGALGGPLKKNKLFLFGNYEGFRQRLAASSDAIVPGPSARLGSLPCTAITPAPKSCPASGILPVPNLNPGMLPYASAFWPAPTGPDLPDGTAHSLTNPSQSVREDYGLVRFDYTASGKDSFSANYSIDNGTKNVPQLDPIFTQLSDINGQTLSTQETHIFSSRTVNVATLGYNRALAQQVNAPAVAIPANLIFVTGSNPGSIIIGGGVITAQPSVVASASGNNPYYGVRNHYTWADDLHFTKGRHAWSAGGWMQWAQQNLTGAAQGSAGNVAYKNMQAFLQDKPTAAILVRNPIPVGYRTREAAWYLQDEITLPRNFSLRLGLRDEMTDGWNEQAGRCTNYFFDPGFVIQTNPHIGDSCLAKNNAKALWQPRVGLAWDPTGRGTWSVRAGFGIHNDLVDNLGIRAYPNPPFNAREQVTITCPAANPNCSTNGWLRQVPFQKNAPLPPTCSPGVPQPCSIYQPAGFDPNMFTPTIQEWSLTVERQLARNLMLEVGYVGSQSYHTSITTDTNVAPPQVCSAQGGCASGGTNAQGLAACGRPGTPACPVVSQGTLYMPPGTRPNPFVSNSIAWFDEGTASYHALSVSLQKRATHGLSFKANYTYAKVIDLNSAILAPAGENEPADVFSPYDLSMNRGVASYSLNNQFNGNFSYQLPFGNGERFGSGASGFVNQMIGGWQWNGIVTAQGGFPLTPLVGSNISGTGDTNPVDVPNWNPNFKGPVVLGRADHWFDPTAFSMPTAGTFGNVSRGSFRGPGLVDVDTSFFKRFKLSEQWTLQFRAELFNIFNHSNFAYPNGIVFSSTAGAITATATTSRQIQFALKLLF